MSGSGTGTQVSGIDDGIYISDFESIYTDIMNRIKQPVSNTTELEKVKRLINERYEDISNVKKWRWLLALSHIDFVGYYNTGTVTVTKDSASVVGVGTTWTTAMAGRRFMVSGYEEVYEIASTPVITATTFSLTTEWQGDTETGASYYIDKEKYTLTSDYDRMVNLRHFFYAFDIEGIGLNRFRKLQISDPQNHSKPNYCTIIGENSSDLTEILFYPCGDEDSFFLPYDYIKKITPLNLDADKPLIPQKYRHVLVEGALADYYRDYKSSPEDAATAQQHEIKYMTLTMRMEKDWSIFEDRPRLIPDLPRFNRQLKSRHSSDVWYLYDKLSD